MKLAKFGDLPPGTIWKDDGGVVWKLKVDATNVYIKAKMSEKIRNDIGWCIALGKSFNGILYWVPNSREVIVWDGKEDLNV